MAEEITNTVHSSIREARATLKSADSRVLRRERSKISSSEEIKLDILMLDGK